MDDRGPVLDKVGLLFHNVEHPHHDSKSMLIELRRRVSVKCGIFDEKGEPI